MRRSQAAWGYRYCADPQRPAPGGLDMSSINLITTKEGYYA